ncbi:MAG: hypothetical protein JXA44_05065 [Methanospirillaceae archaeon]|nr:hypothetical protein [Methanospirillaceae archaeon]
MRITILGTESLGVRGLCCRIQTHKHDILIDPGVALGYLRHGLLPHPCQVAVGNTIRKEIISAFSHASDIIFSHYHGDHVPLLCANPYQLSLKEVSGTTGIKFWCKGPEAISPVSRKRRTDCLSTLKGTHIDAEGIRQDCFFFSSAVPHGISGSAQGSVMMSGISEGNTRFVHASDIQMRNKQAIECILSWDPTIVIASGPPLYHTTVSKQDLHHAEKFVMAIADTADTLILDHHLLRSDKGCRWLDQISEKAGGNVMSAAEFSGRRLLLLEAYRKALYQEIPVPSGWHDAYAQGRIDCTDFMIHPEILERICHTARTRESGCQTG